MFNHSDCANINNQGSASQDNERLVMENETARMFIRSITDVFYKYGMEVLRNNTLYVEFEEDGSRERKMFYDHKITILFQSRSQNIFKNLLSSAPTIVEKRPRFKVEPLAVAPPVALHIEAAFAEATEALTQFKKTLTELKVVLDSLKDEKK